MAKKKLTNYLTDHELVALYQWLAQHQYDPEWSDKVFLVRFILGTGLRIGEASNLMVQDCRMDGIVSVHETKTGVPRMVAVSPELLPYYQAHLLEHVRGPMFRRRCARYGYDNLSVRMLRNWWYDVIKASGTRTVHPHVGRHSYATWELASGRLNIVDIQAQLGHSAVKTTLQYYLHSGVEMRYKNNKVPDHWDKA